jgi:hypothetical protein
VFSCSKIEQKQLNTWVSFQSAEQPLLGQFSVSGNMAFAFSAILYPHCQQLTLRFSLPLGQPYGLTTFPAGHTTGLGPASSPVIQ